MSATKAEWFDHQWSPWSKARKLSQAWRFPVRWDDAARMRGVVPTITTHCDWLDTEVPVPCLARFLNLIHATPNLRWLLPTKRPKDFFLCLERAAANLGKRGESGNRSASDTWGMVFDWIKGRPPSNVWVGTSVEDQPRADERIPELIQIPAAGRFLLCQPLLGPVDLERRHNPHLPDGRPLWPTSEPMLFGIHWVIIGGESGRGAKPCNVDWIRSLVRQCKDAGVAVFVKQLGARPHIDTNSIKSPWGTVTLKSPWGTITHPNGADPSEWPEDLRVREFPEGLR